MVLGSSDRIAVGDTARDAWDLGRPAAVGRFGCPALRAARALTSSASVSAWRHLQLTPKRHSPVLSMLVHIDTFARGETAGELT